jgi:serine/threonine protein kinase
MSASEFSPEINDGKPSSSDPQSESDKDWSVQTAERAYYQRDNVFIKRSLRPSEFKTTMKGTTHVPRLGKEKLQNEAASLRFIRRATNLPVPTVYGAFEVDGSYFLITEYIDGVSMRELPEVQKKVVREEIDQHLATLQGLKSNKLGGLSGSVLPPYRVMHCTDKDFWSLRLSETDEYVFCHNDLTQSNIIVDPVSLKINAIIDWEYAGFYPEYFEGHFYKRVGAGITPSVALEGELDDVPKLLDFLNSQSDE